MSVRSSPAVQIPTDALRSAIQGRIITPADRDYDEQRGVMYGGFDRRPGVIVRVANADDVASVIRVARETGIELAVRGGGHSNAGHSTTDGGIVLDVRDLRTLDIDVQAKTAWAGAGLTAADVTTALAEHGLAIGFGDTGSVGIGGITLGGGVGYLVRKHGLTIDNLLAVEIVTADGELQRADALRLQELHVELVLAARLVHADAAARRDLQAVLRLELHVTGLLAETDAAQLGRGVLQSEIEMA